MAAGRSAITRGCVCSHRRNWRASAVIECRQELLWENDFHARGRILDRERAVRSGIESTLSGEIIKPRMDRSGEPMAPWKDPRTREWPAVH